MLRHRTRAAFPGATHQAGVLIAHEGAGTGLPRVRCLFADDYGTIGERSGRVTIDPVGDSSPSSSPLTGKSEDLDPEVREAWRPLSVSECFLEAVGEIEIGALNGLPSDTRLGVLYP